MNTGLWRSRWAAIGAAVAITLGGGSGLLTVAAAGEPSVLVNVTPTRVLDTRLDVGLAGPNTTGVGRTLDVTGTIPIVLPGDQPGSALVVPDNATAIVANLTAVSPTAIGFVSIRPGDATGTPTTSNINIGNPGGAVPNSITVPIHTDGTVNLFYFGVTPGSTTHLLLDIVGYYQPGGAGTPGPAGPQGAQGPPGPAGNTAKQQRLVTFTNGPNGTGTDNEVQPDIALSADRVPIIAYHDSTLGDLWVVRCVAACGGTTGLAIDSTGTVGWAPSIAIGSDGLAVISYGGTGIGVRVRHCSDVLCSSSTIPPLSLDPAAANNTPTSVAIGVDGFPIVAYPFGVNVRTAKCGDVLCTPGLATITTHASADAGGGNVSVTIGSDGIPIITHQTGSADLAVSRCANVACTSSTQIVADNQSVQLGYDASTTIGVDGFPIIAHRILTNGTQAGSDLRITRCTSLTCSTAVSSTMAVTVNADGLDPSIAIGADGIPLVAYSDDVAKVLKLARCADVNCTAIEDIPNDAGPQSGVAPSIMLDAFGFPVIASVDQSSNNDIRLTITTNQGWGP